MEVSNMTKARTVNGQLNLWGQKLQDVADPRPVVETQPMGKHGAAECKLLEAMLSPANLEGAWQSVKANAGAAGIDGMSVDAFPAFWEQHKERIIAQLREGTYRPAAVRRVWIPKGNGEQRPLGVPTVLDRVVQQAISQILSLMLEGDFSEHSYGFDSVVNSFGLRPTLRVAPLRFAPSSRKTCPRRSEIDTRCSPRGQRLCRRLRPEVVFR